MKLLPLLAASAQSWKKDKTSLLAASLAYYTVFALPPLLLIIVSTAGFFVQGSTVKDELASQITLLMGERGGAAFRAIFETIERSEYSSVATIVGTVMLVIGATGVMVHLQHALNTIWRVTPAERKGVTHFFIKRLLSLGLILALGFLLIVSLVLSTVAAFLADVFISYIPTFAYALPLVDFGLSYVLVFLLFALLFKFLPDVRIVWNDVWVGSALTALLYMLGKSVIGFYLAHNTMLSAYGAVGSVIVLMVWIYYSAQILLFGAEFTRVYSEEYGSRIRPAEGARSTTHFSWLHHMNLFFRRIVDRIKDLF